MMIVISAGVFSKEEIGHPERKHLAHEVVDSDRHPRRPGLMNAARKHDEKFTQKSAGQGCREKRQTSAQKQDAYEHAHHGKERERPKLRNLGEQHDHEGRIDQILSQERNGIHPAARECNQETREFGGSGKDTDEHELSRFPTPFNPLRLGRCHRSDGSWNKK